MSAAQKLSKPSATRRAVAVTGSSARLPKSMYKTPELRDVQAPAPEVDDVEDPEGTLRSRCKKHTAADATCNPDPDKLELGQACQVSAGATGAGMCSCEPSRRKNVVSAGQRSNAVLAPSDRASDAEKCSLRLGHIDEWVEQH